MKNLLKKGLLTLSLAFSLAVCGKAEGKAPTPNKTPPLTATAILEASACFTASGAIFYKIATAKVEKRKDGLNY